jgi:hypothetical protein
MEKVKPKAVVVFSAHWQARRNEIYVNNAEHTDLIYESVQAPESIYLRRQGDDTKRRYPASTGFRNTTTKPHTPTGGVPSWQTD